MMTHIDLWLFRLVNAWSGNWVLDRLVGYEEGNNLFKGGLLLIAYWWFWFAGPADRRDGRRRTILAVLCGALLALVLNRVLSAALPFRVRPMFVSGIGYRPPAIALPMNLEDWSSFPSDTATYFFALAYGLFRLSRPLGAALLAYVIVWVELPRLYLGIHYPSDVIVGGAIGIVGVGSVLAAADARGGVLGRRLAAPLLAAESRLPGLFYAAAFALSYEMAMIFDDLRNVVRGAVRALRFAGYLTLGEGAALFLVGGGALAVLVVGWMVVTVGRCVRRHRRSPTAGLNF